MPIPPISIKAFGGETPAVDSRLLADNAASDCVNAWLFSGRIEPVHALSPLHVMQSEAARSWFRLPIGAPGVDNMIDSYWMEFENENVRVVRSPVVGQEDQRFYWADGIFPKMITASQIKQMNAEMKGAWSASVNYNINDGVTSGGVTYVAIQAGINHPPASSPTFWVVMPKPIRLGVPAPIVAPGVATSGGASSTNKTVSYAYTWVTNLGEEGPPSPPTTVTYKIDGTYTITVTAPSPSATADRNLTKTRIYRTVVSSQGVATFFFVAEIPIATLSYVDNAATFPDSVIVNNEQLRTILWSEPPADLQGMVAMPNGFFAGWRKNEVWFSEPYYPHSWPIIHVLGVDAEIVGLGVHNQSVIVLTAGQPYAATGVAPESMTLAMVQPLEPCTSRRSIVNTPNGVLYSSPNGLINITSQGAVNLTKDLILKDQWYAKLNLSTVMATTLVQGYYAYSGPSEGVFQVDLDVADARFDTFQHDAFQSESAFGTKPGLFISLGDTRVAVTVLDPSPSEVFNLIQDIYNGETMVLRDGIVYLVDIRQTGPYAKYRWKSKIFTMPYLQNLGAAKVYWTPKDPAAPDEPSYFRVYAGHEASQIDDGLPLKFTQKMTKSGQIFRLPSGYKALYYQFEVEGLLNIDAIHCAQTAHELRQI